MKHLSPLRMKRLCPPRPTRLAALAVVAVLPFAIAACGEKHDQLGPGKPQSMTLMLDWVPNADHVGLYQALADGDFTKAGLDVRVETPPNPDSPLQLLAAGKVDIAISYEPEVLLARNQGQPLVSVGAIVQRPLTSIVSVGKQHITSVKQLRGKTVGYAGIPYQQAYLDTILTQAGVPVSSVRLVNVGSNLVPAMVSGRVAATIGAYWNYEAIQLKRMGKHPNVIPVDHVGIPSYDELVLVVRRSELATSSDQIRQFVQALGRGYQAVRSNPALGVSNLVKANPGLDPKFQSAAVRATLPAFFPSNPSRPWGWQDSSQWNSYGQWMLGHHLISNPNAIVDASTNEVLAGQGI
jgi:putative hydroxymethylpyrimidine transport system substrate-binding protein